MPTNDWSPTSPADNDYIKDGAAKIRELKQDIVERWGNPLSAYTSLANAVSTLGATVAILLIDRAETLTTNVTIPSNITVVYCPGGFITVGAYNLTIQGKSYSIVEGTSASCTGNAATATALATARTIGGVSFDGTANINLPGVNTAGNQNTSGNAATATNATYATSAGNADTVDGYHAASFSLTTHNHDSSYAPLTAFVAATATQTAGDPWYYRIRFTRANGSTLDVATGASGSTGGGG